MHRPSRALTLALALVALAKPQATGAAGPVQLTKGAAETVIKALQKDRADSENWLRSDATSYLATIARRDFGDKKTLVGDRFHVKGVDQQARVKVNTLAVAIRAGEMDSHYH
jgi:hypothetical protein